MKKVKILYYNSTLSKGGTDKYMFDVVLGLDSKKFEVDVIIKDGDVVDEFMLNGLTSAGHKVFLAKGSLIKQLLAIKKYFSAHKGYYDVIHINATSNRVGIIAYLARKFGKFKKIIFHSHIGGTTGKDDLFNKIGRHLMLKNTTHFASCSKSATDYLFGKDFDKTHKVYELKNAVDTDKFTFNEEIRKAIRNELCLKDDELAVLHVGRFAPEKNHKLLLKIFARLLSDEPKAKLILIGNGVLLDEIKTFASELGINDSVMFLSTKDNVYDYMQASDCFVMTSLFEGFPIVAVEAEATGLPCVLSGNISEQVKLTKHVKFVPLDADIEEWKNAILTQKGVKRASNKQILTEKGFDQKSAIKEIEKLYSSSEDKS